MFVPYTAYNPTVVCILVYLEVSMEIKACLMPNMMETCIMKKSSPRSVLCFQLMWCEKQEERKWKAWGSEMTCPSSGSCFPACNPVPEQWITLLTKGQFVKERAPTGKQQASTCLLTSLPDLSCLSSVLRFTTLYNVQKCSQHSSEVATDSEKATDAPCVCAFWMHICKLLGMAEY